MTGNETETSTDVETFDWQTEPEGVMRWALPTLLANVDQATLDDLAARTAGFREVALQVHVNGVELPARPLLEGLVHHLDDEVQRRAAELLRQVSWLETLQLHVEALEQALSQRVRDAARELELPLEFFEED